MCSMFCGRAKKKKKTNKQTRLEEQAKKNNFFLLFLSNLFITGPLRNNKASHRMKNVFENRMTSNDSRARHLWRGRFLILCLYQFPSENWPIRSSPPVLATSIVRSLLLLLLLSSTAGSCHAVAAG